MAAVATLSALDASTSSAPPRTNATGPTHVLVLSAEGSVTTGIMCALPIFKCAYENSCSHQSLLAPSSEPACTFFM